MLQQAEGGEIAEVEAANTGLVKKRKNRTTRESGTCTKSDALLMIEGRGGRRNQEKRAAHIHPPASYPQRGARLPTSADSLYCQRRKSREKKSSRRNDARVDKASVEAAGGENQKCGGRRELTMGADSLK